MSSKRVLVIEDDASIRRGLVDALTFSGYEVLQSGDGADGCKTALRASYDLLLLDLILPGRDGFSILQNVRTERPILPIIILTARGEEAERVRGLRLGADDYVVKPFSIRELLARIEAVLRRSPERPDSMSRVSLTNCVADFSRCEIRHENGTRTELSEREVDLLRYLASNAGRAISRDELLRRIWRLEPSHLETRTIDMHIANLRTKLHDDPDNPRILFTVRGKGYMFAPPEPRVSKRLSA